jgi:hypothetical protein
MHALLLKAAATVLTLVAAGAAALHVGANVKTSSAPLHPSVLGVTAKGGKLSLSPSVRSGDVQAVTSTYAS